MVSQINTDKHNVQVTVPRPESYQASIWDPTSNLFDVDAWVAYEARLLHDLRLRPPYRLFNLIMPTASRTKNGKKFGLYCRKVALTVIFILSTKAEF